MRKSVLRAFYVDNCLPSLPGVDEAKRLVDKLQSLLAEGGYELRQWASNRTEVISHLPTIARSDGAERWITQGYPDGRESLLGLQWHCQADTLSYKLRTSAYPQVTLHTVYKTLAEMGSQSRWFQGLSFLYQSPGEWPKVPNSKDLDVTKSSEGEVLVRQKRSLAQLLSH